MRARAVRPLTLLFSIRLIIGNRFHSRMVAAIAGPYGKNYSQGKVGGVLAELGFMAGQVWKL